MCFLGPLGVATQAPCRGIHYLPGGNSCVHVVSFAAMLDHGVRSLVSCDTMLGHAAYNNQQVCINQHEGPDMCASDLEEDVSNAPPSICLPVQHGLLSCAEPVPGHGPSGDPVDPSAEESVNAPLESRQSSVMIDHTVSLKRRRLRQKTCGTTCGGVFQSATKDVHPENYDKATYNLWYNKARYCYMKTTRILLDQDADNNFKHSEHRVRRQQLELSWSSLSPEKKRECITQFCSTGKIVGIGVPGGFPKSNPHQPVVWACAISMEWAIPAAEFSPAYLAETSGMQSLCPGSREYENLLEHVRLHADVLRHWSALRAFVAKLAEHLRATERQVLP
jgi:hypothetical protein